MNSALAIVTSARFDGAYRDVGQMIEAMIGRVAIVAREFEWPGMKLADFEQAKADFPGAVDPEADIFTIRVEPATSGAVTIDQCRNFLKERRARELARRVQGELL